MYKQILQYLKSIVQALIVFCLLSALMDWYRQPAQPPISPSQTLITLSNQPVTLNDFSRNRISLLYFWGSWCGICKYTSPSIEALHQDGIPVISIALKSGSDREITTYMQNHGMHFPTVTHRRNTVHFPLLQTQPNYLIHTNSLKYQLCLPSKQVNLSLRPYDFVELFKKID